MHYDIESGVKNTKGIFSPLSIMLMAGLLLLIGAYAGINYFSPDIFARTTGGMRQIEQDAKTQQPLSTEDRLRIPSAGVDVPISEKLTEASVWWKKTGYNQVVLASKKRSVGLTPLETVNQSPLYNLDKVKIGDAIYVDINGERHAYEVTELSHNKAIAELADDLVIYSYTQPDAQIGSTVLTAKRIGTVDWSTGRAAIESN